MMGVQNTVSGTAINDPDKSRGSSVDLLLGDEFGNFPKFNE
jgi:hypothetical protein